MATLFSSLKTAVAAYLQRDTTTFVVGSFDMLQLACNNAKNYCQRSVDLEFARQFAQVTSVSLANGGLLTDATLFGSATTLVIKSIERAFVNTSADGQFPIDIISRDAYTRRLQRRFANVRTIEQAAEVYSGVRSTNLVLVQYGQRFYVYPASSNVFGGASTIDVFFDVIEWLPDMVNNSDTNFLLDYCFDFLMYRSIYELNFFLKEDQRVGISSALLDDVWKNVINWNKTIVGNTVDDNTLD